MALPEKIKSIFKKIGSRYSIVTPTGLQADEDWFCEPELNTQVTKPFVLLNFLKVNFPFDTEVKPGDTIEFLTGNSRYLVTVMLPEMFRDRIIKYLSVLYRCNDSATILRKTYTRDDNLKKIVTWSPFGITWPALVADPYLGSELSENSDDDLQGVFSDDKQNLYISGDSGIVLGDRIFLAVKNGNHMVSKIKTTRYDNVLEIELDDDNRD